MNCLRSVVLASLVIVGIAGCDTSGGPSVSYVEGVVTLDGQPVEGASIGFSPVAEGGVGGVGTTDANGVYKLTTPTGTVDGGVPAGDYNVTITKKVMVGGTPEVTSSSDPNYGKQDASGSGPPQAPQYEDVVPVKYNSAATSGIKVTVKSGRNTGDEFKFDLKKE
jgi:hypothetical protein